MHRLCVFLFGIITPFLFIACLGASETAHAPDEFSDVDDTTALLSLTIVKGDLSMDSIYLVITDAEDEFLVVENGVELGAATIFFELTVPQSRDITLEYVCFNNGAVVARKNESVVVLGELALESVPDEMPTLFSAGNDTIIALKERYTVPIVWEDNSFHVSYAIQFVESEEFTEKTSHIYNKIGTYSVVVHAFDGYNNVFDTVVVTVENNRSHASSFAVADNPSSSEAVPQSSMVSVSSAENVSSSENISSGTTLSASSETSAISSSSSTNGTISSVAVVQSSSAQGTSSMQGPLISSATGASSQEILSSQTMVSSQTMLSSQSIPSSQETQESSSAPQILYTVIFDGNGSNASVPPATVAPGSLLTEPSAPIQSGYTFDGWYNGNTLWSFSQGVTTDFTLQARWTVITYRVSFDLNGGNGSIASATVNAGSTVARPTAPTRDGYTFIGWYNGASE
ncbi:MAG: InlB B-repeat-containing protein, partial [Fibrobacterales bacterium]